MNATLLFFLNAIGFGVGLATDAFSVSLANGLNEPGMKPRKMCGIAAVFAGFQTAMPFIGWLCVHTLVSLFTSFQRFIPWIALALLTYMGGKMIFEGIKNKGGVNEKPVIGFPALMVQGVVTSIDELSVGFTMAEYPWKTALLEAVMIGIVTFSVCIAGLAIGKKFGTKLAGKASILGGVILIAIGMEIFVQGITG